MDFLLIQKDKFTPLDIKNRYPKSLEVFEKRGQQESKTFENEKYLIKVYDGLTSKCYFKEFDNGDFIVVLGTLIYKEQYGFNSLQSLFDDFKQGKRNLYNDLIGSFSVLIYVENRLYTFNDFLGLMRVYHSTDYSIFSTSFLAAARLLASKTPSDQEIFEYIIRGGTYGDKTILKEVNLIPRSTAVCISDREKGEKLEFNYEKLPFSEDFNKMVDHISNEYLRLFKILGDCFKDNITTALSGGYDTRLMLALLRMNNIKPHIYVYGNDNSQDVLVAKNIANGEGFSLEHINRNNIEKIELGEFPKVISNNFYFFDGLGVLGIFDNGSDVKTRMQRSSEGVVQLNGAGGEVWRNFWQLNSMGKKTLDFALHKWDIYDYNALSQKFNKQLYFKTFANKIESSIGGSIVKGKLTRKEMEMSYPLYRYRYWQSIGNSISLKFSNTIMPLMETRFLYPSFDLPIKYKNNGVFEAALIKKIDPKLASYKSDRGFNFIEKVPLKSRVETLIMNNIPLTIKPFLRHNFTKRTKEIDPYFLDDSYINQVVNMKESFVSNYVDINKIEDSLKLSRALTVEYFFNHI